MKLVIIGAGKVAYYLIRELTQEHEIIIVEKDESAAMKISNSLSAVVIHGDGTTLPVLEPVCQGADMLIALTGKDENNLIACQIAKKLLHVPMTMARVNNPKNLEVMEKFGVDKSFSGTKVLAEMIEQEIDYHGLTILRHIKNSNHVLIEFDLSARSKAAGKTLAEYTFIAGSRIVIITYADGRVITPSGSTKMRAGDRLMMVCASTNVEDIWKEMVSL